MSVIQFESISMLSSPTNLNPSATTFIYGGNIHSDLDNVEMMNNTNAFEMNKECGGTRDAGMSLTSNLNSLDTIFMFKDNCPVDNKFYNKMVDSVATNNDTVHSASSRLQTISGDLIFMEFILILSSYIVNAISVYNFTKVFMCRGGHKCRGCNQHIKVNQDQEHK